MNCDPTRRIVEEARGRGFAPTYLNGRGETVEITGLPTTFTLTSGNGELDITEPGVGELRAGRPGVRRAGEPASGAAL